MWMIIAFFTFIPYNEMEMELHSYVNNAENALSTAIENIKFHANESL